MYYDMSDCATARWAGSTVRGRNNAASQFSKENYCVCYKGLCLAAGARARRVAPATHCWAQACRYHGEIRCRRLSRDDADFGTIQKRQKLEIPQKQALGSGLSSGFRQVELKQYVPEILYAAQTLRYCT